MLSLKSATLLLSPQPFVHYKFSCRNGIVEILKNVDSLLKKAELTNAGANMCMFPEKDTSTEKLFINMKQCLLETGLMPNKTYLYFSRLSSETAFTYSKQYKTMASQ
jgi:hypothetical protein